MYDMYAEAASEILPESVLNITWKLEAWVVSRARATIIVDDARRKQIVGMKPRVLEVLYNAPEEVAMSVVSKKSNVLEVFYVGVLDYSRGFRYLVNAITGVERTHLTIGGFGVHQKEVEALCVAREECTFIGRVSYKEVIERSLKSDVLFALYDPEVKNHRYSSPNKLFEAMMLGLPIIVSNGTGMSDIVERVGNGLVIPYGDADALKNAVEKLHDKKLRDTMGKKGREAYVTDYGWPVMHQRLLAVYRSIEVI
jgi:glycosyltransferase involved in cell wall biosynthesis